MSKAKFGKAPAGARLERILRSPNYRNGQFQNLSHTPQLAEGYTMRSVLYRQLFKKVANRIPKQALPSLKTNLKRLSPDANVLLWFGHSSYFIQLEGKRILVDPVMSGNASPIPGTVKAFDGSDIYTPDDLPAIDYLFISHDHYDHLDHATLTALKSKVSRVICGLGVGAHLEYWGYAPDCITEADWYETIVLDKDIVLHTTPARHFSGRSFSRNNTLWLSFVLQCAGRRFFLGGDSGYDTHFSAIGERFGPFDLAILENGQYDAAWRYIHALPHETIQAAHDLKAQHVLPVHSSKFALANHAWYEPLATLTAPGNQNNLPLLTPMIGEPVDLDNLSQPFSRWWEGLA